MVKEVIVLYQTDGAVTQVRIPLPENPKSLSALQWIQLAEAVYVEFSDDEDKAAHMASLPDVGYELFCVVAAETKFYY